MARKTFKYRAYPTRAQTTKMVQTLTGCRWLYNHFLDQRIISWKEEKQSLSRYGQSNTLKALKVSNPFLKEIHSQVLQNVSGRIDLAFRSFFRRLKTKENPGFPRFQGHERYDSFTFSQSGFKLTGKFITLSKIGNVKIKLHRPTEGIIKTCTIKRTPTGKWFVTFSCKIETEPTQKAVNPAIGFDMGLEHFLTTSNGEHIENPRFFKKEKKALAKAQRKLSAQKKASKARTKAKKVVARVHERIINKRHNFAHQLSKKFVDKYNTIYVEDLSINDMKKDNFRCINRSIGDVAWRQFLNLLDFKAACAGGRVVKTNPAFTSQNCSNCGNRQKLKLSDRVYHCPCCDLSLQRDHNAALNIMSLGVQTLGKDLQSLTLEATGI